jgi:hypothetical protein
MALRMSDARERLTVTTKVEPRRFAYVARLNHDGLAALSATGSALAAVIQRRGAEAYRDGHCTLQERPA